MTRIFLRWKQKTQPGCSKTGGAHPSTQAWTALRSQLCQPDFGLLTIAKGPNLNDVAQDGSYHSQYAVIDVTCNHNRGWPKRSLFRQVPQYVCQFVDLSGGKRYGSRARVNQLRIGQSTFTLFFFQMPFDLSQGNQPFRLYLRLAPLMINVESYRHCLLPICGFQPELRLGDVNGLYTAQLLFQHLLPDFDLSSGPKWDFFQACAACFARPPFCRHTLRHTLPEGGRAIKPGNSQNKID